MKIESFPFQTFNWSTIPKEEHNGDSGFATWQTQHLNDIRVRKVEYSPGYKANHWCHKGHVLFCMEGEMETELEDGRVMKLTAGSVYLVGDHNEAHRSSTKNGCKLFIVD
jgi:quercetin dioxygenase-like cupin family protein